MIFKGSTLLDEETYEREENYNQDAYPDYRYNDCCYNDNDNEDGEGA